MKKMNGTNFLTIEEVCKKLSISKVTLMTYRRKKIIRYYQIGGFILFKESDIENFINNSKVETV